MALPDESPELLRALVTSVADAIYLVDADGRVRFANPAALEVLGYDSETDLIDRPSHATIHHKHPDGTPYPEHDCPLLRPRATGEVVRVDEDWFVRRDGSMVPVAYSSAPVETAGGGRGAVVVFRDISERHAAAALASSRRRVVAAADEERRRIGRDIHDGAQQRLVQVGLAMQMARAKLGESDGAAAARELLDEALTETRAALDDLREIAAGLHPAILTNRGLRAAIDSLTARAQLPVETDIAAERFDPEVEAAAYYVIAEALANAGKHSGADAATVTARVEDGSLLIEVTDDGAGGATPGGGLHGIDDRVSTLGGDWSLDSPPGGGTRVRVELPVERF